MCECNYKFGESFDHSKHCRKCWRQAIKNGWQFRPEGSILITFPRVTNNNIVTIIKCCKYGLKVLTNEEKEVRHLAICKNWKWCSHPDRNNRTDLGNIADSRGGTSNYIACELITRCGNRCPGFSS